ncbi:hypothetical protein CHS0354_019343 [Potamilus streckersoni]|uniref:Uncharacterized protein n=1 Tax=Potamilus streckersoni TaxID=2493646 RepID=A0AAE0SHF9_9BIVA|nr:hypothetical protein CHS0354_019343 [Potamilus streckersoni]
MAEMLKRFLSHSPASNESRERKPVSKSSSDGEHRRILAQTMIESPGVGYKPVVAQSKVSLVGVLASKKFAQKLSGKILLKKDVDRVSEMESPMEMEASYRMEPYKKFNASTVEGIMKTVLEAKLDGYKYNPKFSANMIKVLSEEIKDGVKELNYDRYKIICIVHLGELKGQGLSIASRSSWDCNLDNYASYSSQKENTFCTAVVYASCVTENIHFLNSAQSYRKIVR